MLAAWHHHCLSCIIQPLPSNLSRNITTFTEYPKPYVSHLNHIIITFNLVSFAFTSYPILNHMFLFEISLPYTRSYIFNFITCLLPKTASPKTNTPISKTLKPNITSHTYSNKAAWRHPTYRTASLSIQVSYFHKTEMYDVICPSYDIIHNHISLTQNPMTSSQESNDVILYNWNT